jgi:hypothetical protein
MSGNNTINLGTGSMWLNPWSYGPCSFGGTGTFTGNYLVVGASSTVSGAMTFNLANGVQLNGGTFKGGHTINGNLIAAASSYATISPSNDGVTPETLTVVGNVTLDSTTTLNYKLTTPGLSDGGSGQNDFIAISGTGNLILDGTLNITGPLPFHTGDYRLMNYTGSLTDNILNVGTTPDPTNLTYTITTGGGHVDLIVNLAYVLGDVNHDGAVNSLDIDAIYGHFGTGSLFAQWDVNGDGVVNQDDVTFELTDAAIGLKTEYGDANLDHKVNFSDFQVLLDHWQATGGTWATGDFNGDTVVNFGDFQKLLDYWNPAGYGTSVPEPATLVLLGLGVLAMLRRRK